MDKEIEESKNKDKKYKIANEAVIKTQINKIHEHEKKAEEYLKQLEDLEDKSKNLIKFIQKKDDELTVKKFDIICVNGFTFLSAIIEVPFISSKIIRNDGPL